MESLSHVRKTECFFSDSKLYGAIQREYTATVSFLVKRIPAMLNTIKSKTALRHILDQLPQSQHASTNILFVTATWQLKQRQDQQKTSHSHSP